MSDPPPLARERKTSEEGMQAPVKPIPRVRRAMSPPRVPPPPPPVNDTPSNDTPSEQTQEEQTTADQELMDTESVEQIDIDDIHLNEDDDDSSLEELRKVSVTSNDEQLHSEGEEDEEEPDYMNWSEIKLQISNEDIAVDNTEEPPGKKRTSRPLSNYHNVAPLLEPQARNTTMTTGQATVNSNTIGTSQEDSPNSSGYRFKPKHRAPAIPPPGFKKLPPIDSNLLSTTAVESDTKVVTNISRNRPVVKRTKSIPLQPPSPSSPPSLPKSPVPVKPPRSRMKHDLTSPSSPATSPIPPPLSHPVVIPSKAEQLSRSSSPLLIKAEERSSSPNEIKKDRPLINETQRSSPVLLPRKAPPPPPNTETTPSKTPPTNRKVSSGAILSLEYNKTSPAGVRKAARVAPPPPKPYKLLDKDEGGKNDKQPSSSSSSSSSSPQVPPKAISNTMDKDIVEGRKESMVEEVTTVKSEALQAIKKTLSNVQTILDSTGANNTGQEEEEEEEYGGEDDTEVVLSRMNLFTVEMRKVDGQGFGLHIAEGYTQTSKGLEVKGVFVKEIVPGSPADNCGRVRESDMIIEIASCSMLGASLEDAARILKHSGNIVRLKIGRTFSSSKENNNGGNGTVLDLPLSPLQEENEKLKAELSSTKEQLEDSEESNEDLKQAVIKITVDKTKLDMEVESLKSKLEKEKAKRAAMDKQPSKDNEQVEELHKKVEELTKAKTSLEVKLDSVGKENSSKLEEMAKDHEVEMSSKEKESERFRGEVDSLKAEVEQEKNKRKELSQLLSARDEEMKSLKNELEKEKKEKEISTNSLSEKITALETELANSKEMVVIEVKEKPEEKENKVDDTNQKVVPDSKEAVPDSQKAVPDSQKAVPDSQKAVPDSQKAVPDSQKAVPDSQEAVPNSQKAVPDSQKAVPDSQKAVPDSQKAVPDSQKAVPDSQKAVPDSQKVVTHPDGSKDSPKKKSKKQLIVESKKGSPSKKSPSKKSPSKETTPTEIESTPPPSEKRSIIKEENGEQTDSLKLNASQEELRISRETTPLTDEDEGGMFNELKSMDRLNSSTAIQKSHLSSQLRRKRPTRSHVKSLANLSPFPENMPTLKVFSDENRKSVSETNLPSVAPKPRARNEDKGGPVAAPKPKPRPQPRKKQSPDHSSNDNPPKTPPESPVPAKRPIPVPRTPSREASLGDTDTAQKKNSDYIPESPKRSPILPPKPKDSNENTEHLPVVKPKPRPTSDVKHDEETVEDIPVEQQEQPVPVKRPKPVPPKPSTQEKKPPTESTSDGIDAKLEALKQKDPSELTVKEKMMLAQQAMAKQAELKSKGLPPPVRRRPQLPHKAESLDIGADERPANRKSKDETDGNMERSQSVDDLLDGEVTPKRQPKKLPPGAFNLGIPMGLPGDNRIRSHTFGSSTSDQTKSLEASMESSQPESEEVISEDQSDPLENGIPPQDNESEDTQEEVPPVEKTTPQTTPRHKKIENEETSDITTVSTPEISGQDAASMGSMDNLSDDETIESNEALLETQATRTSSSHLPDAEQILYWSPEVVGLWMGSIGLGQYAQVIKERGIKGYMLFDLDSARLKGMGINSGDERKTFAKEVKALKPYAEKLKKDHERQRKEEKKRQEQEKKLAKKKKK